MTPVQIMKDYKTWAVVGATNRKDKYGYKIYRKLKAIGYNVYPISPNYDEIDGDKAYKSITDLPEKPEVVNFVVNPKIGMNIVEECAQLGVKHIWLQPGTVSDELLALAEEKGIEATQACVLIVSHEV